MKARIALVMAVLLFSSGSAHASPQTEWPSKRRLWFLPTGLSLGAAMYPGLPDADTSFIVGGEVSFVTLLTHPYGHAPEPWQPWVGGYVDGVVDTANVHGRISLGPELGYGLFGIDGGPVVQIGGERLDVGGQFRLFVSFASFVTFYGRQGFIPAAPDVSRYTEIGALLKYPFPLSH